jgi:hypothetical protein
MGGDLMVARVTVYEAQISKAFYPGGQVWDRMREVKMINYYAAIAYCPVRTGDMMNSIRHAQLPDGKYSSFYSIAVDAEHAYYVLQGTLDQAPIRPTNGKYMWMRPRPWSHLPFNTQKGTGGRWPFKSVAGQKANDFLGRSLRFTMKATGL